MPRDATRHIRNGGEWMDGWLDVAYAIFLYRCTVWLVHVVYVVILVFVLRGEDEHVE